MNHLQNASSKYLLQHAHNPVDWYPWGDEPFEKAKKENKPVLVSIGYAACHWCHVMERESFEDTSVADLMNKYFVCIKVDREEHPDVDHFYMDALQSLSGNGGWPLNMFVTPDRKPFYGGTYFPPKAMYGRTSWMELLKIVAKAWAEKQPDITIQSSEMMHHLKEVSEIEIASVGTSKMDQDLVTGICRNLLVNADKEWGGFGEAPKFPASFTIQFLFDFYQLQKRRGQVDELGQDAFKQATLTLDKMLSGGIYDHVGGGFFRYSTDVQWQIPHYEKMLYDNALMISVLAVAYRVTKKETYKKALEETVAFCNRELKGQDCPGFFCSLDADTDGVEGGYYFWTTKDWKKALPHPNPSVVAYFGMEGETEETLEHPLIGVLSDEEVCERFQLSKPEWERILADAKGKLLLYRDTRKRPDTDNKMLLSWNSLMNCALQDAAIVLNEDTFLKQAEEHLCWMQRAFEVDRKGWKHVFKEGRAYIDAKLDDCSFFIHALINYSECTGHNTFLALACEYLKEILPLFQSERSLYFYYSSLEQKDIPIRKIEIYDGAQPSANAVMAENLLLLGECYGNNDWRNQGVQMLEGIGQTTRRFARSFSRWAILIQRTVACPKQVVLASTQARLLLKKWGEDYFPDVTVWAVTTQGAEIPLLRDKLRNQRQDLYLCYDMQCLKPVKTIEELKNEIKKIG